MTPSEEAVPLSEAELNELETLLDSNIFGSEALLPDELQGLFFAVASAPDIIPSSRWLPVAIGSSEPAEDKEAQQAIKLIMRFYEQCARDVAGENFELI